MAFISYMGRRVDNVRNGLEEHLNFYRIHILFFTFIPLFLSGIFYASNGEYKISYVDSLFNCVSAITMCGLATVNLSSLTPWQQVILFIQMCIGSPTVVSWVVVYIRQRYIATHCSHIFEAYISTPEGSPETTEITKPKRNHWRKVLCSFGASPITSLALDPEHAEDKRGPKSIRPDMIRRVDDQPRLVNPSGLITAELPRVELTAASNDSSTHSSPAQALSRHPSSSSSDGCSSGEKRTEITSKNGDVPLSPEDTQPGFPRTVTFDFALPNKERPRIASIIHEDAPVDTRDTNSDHASRHHFPTHLSLRNHPTHQTFHSQRTYHSHHTHPSFHIRKNQGFGGFPMPFAILKSLFRKFFPSLNKKLKRTLTIPIATSLVSTATRNAAAKHAPYVKTTILVRRNSLFPELTVEQTREIAELEYQSLRLLLWVVAIYYIGVQLISFIVIAPYISIPYWRQDFVPPQLIRPVNTVWFSAFQVVSAYTNTGTSLVDQSMIPFQTAYPMILFMIFLILAGNTCFPIFLRFFLFCLLKFTREGRQLHKTVHFLLDHPRRCFLYLFPSHQTWFLLTIVIILTCIDWISFLILDLGNAALKTIPVNVRVLAGFMQAIAVRAAGFSIVPLAALNPGVKVLYVIMMYISVYPIAMSVRSTNVYEENSLGVFPEELPSSEESFNDEGPRMSVWSRYLAMHARQQLAFDMWWIALALFLVCIIERSNLQDPEEYSWFNIFDIIFELVSAYGTVGLSLGIPDQNYSFCGAFRPLSKLIVCLVMLRGRHRGLPVAIDRAVMFPREYQNDKDDTEGEREATGSESQPADVGSSSSFRERKSWSRQGNPDDDGMRSRRDILQRTSMATTQNGSPPNDTGNTEATSETRVTTDLES